MASICDRHPTYYARMRPTWVCKTCWAAFYESLEKPTKKVKGKKGAKSGTGKSAG